MEVARPQALIGEHPAPHLRLSEAGRAWVSAWAAFYSLMHEAKKVNGEGEWVWDPPTRDRDELARLRQRTLERSVPDKDLHEDLASSGDFYGWRGDDDDFVHPPRHRYEGAGLKRQLTLSEVS